MICLPSPTPHSSCPTCHWIQNAELLMHYVILETCRVGILLGAHCPPLEILVFSGSLAQKSGVKRLSHCLKVDYLRLMGFCSVVDNSQEPNREMNNAR